MKWLFVLLVSTLFAFAGTGLAQDTELKITSKPKATLTDAARRNITVGEVRLSVQFMETGKIGEIKVLTSLPDGLVEKAIAAAHKIEFEPKRVNGVAISVTKTVEYSFDIIIGDDNPDIKHKVKLIKGPVFNFDAIDKKWLGGRRYKIEVYFSRTGSAFVGSIMPKVSENLKKKIETAIKAIVFEPAMMEDRRKVSVKKTYDFN